MEVASYQVVRPLRRCYCPWVGVAFGSNCNHVPFVGFLFVKVRDFVWFFFLFLVWLE